MSEWIKVTEQMPPANTRVLISYSGVVYEGVWVEELGDSWWTGPGGWGVLPASVHKITHWRYLPEPPVQEEK